MQSSKPAHSRTRVLVVVASAIALLSAVFGTSVFVTIQHRKPPPQRQDHGSYIINPRNGTPCHQIVFDNDTSGIVTSAEVACDEMDDGYAHKTQVPLGSLRYGVTDR
jgi:hypothetical protein